MNVSPWFYGILADLWSSLKFVFILFFIKLFFLYLFLSWHYSETNTMYDKGKLIAVIDEGTKTTRVVVSEINKTEYILFGIYFQKFFFFALFFSGRFSNRNHILRSYARMKFKSNKFIRMTDGWNKIHWPFWKRYEYAQPKQLTSWTTSFRIFTVKVI